MHRKPPTPPNPTSPRQRFCRNWRARAILCLRGSLTAVALWVTLPPATSQPVDPATTAAAALQVQVLEGQGPHLAGRKATRPLTVLVVDERGQPVEGAVVSFRMPASGPSGTFPSGLPTEILVTGPEGTATIWGIRWGSTPGTVQIRIVAVKGELRAGTLATVQLIATDSATQGRGSRGPSVIKPGKKWLPILVIAAGAAAGGLALGLSQSGQSQAAVAAGQAASGSVQAPPVQVGFPTITVGQP